MGEQILLTANPDRWSPYFSIKYSILTQYSKHVYILFIWVISDSLLPVTEFGGQVHRILCVLAETTIYPSTSWCPVRCPVTQHKWQVPWRMLELSDHLSPLSDLQEDLIIMLPMLTSVPIRRQSLNS